MLGTFNNKKFNDFLNLKIAKIKEIIPSAFIETTIMDEDIKIEISRFMDEYPNNSILFSANSTGTTKLEISTNGKDYKIIMIMDSDKNTDIYYLIGTSFYSDVTRLLESVMVKKQNEAVINDEETKELNSTTKDTTEVKPSISEDIDGI